MKIICLLFAVFLSFANVYAQDFGGVTFLSYNETNETNAF